jgi:hypothetical protein
MTPEAVATWSPVIPGVLWDHERDGDVPGFPLRSVAIGLRSGGACVVSPTRDVAPTSLGRPVELLLASNHFHWLGIPDWMRQLEGSPPTVVASDVARGRVAKKIRSEVHDLGVLEAALPAGVTLLVPEGTRSGEVWLEVEGAGERVWVVCDAFFNMPSLPGGFAGWALGATGTGPGLKLGHTWKYLQLSDRSRYKEWLLGRLEQRPPTVLVVAHGQILRDVALGTRLRAIVEERL